MRRENFGETRRDGKVWLLENPYKSENGKRRRARSEGGIRLKWKRGEMGREERKDFLQVISYLSNPKIFTDIL